MELKRFKDGAGTVIFINPDQVQSINGTSNPDRTAITFAGSETVFVVGDVEDIAEALVKPAPSDAQMVLRRP
ncbi:hypothetical protein [Phenylobacterium sp.]|uniref:hypothetical protein n=1 Tax=Phenylobacterium sp. TaxID=1871053 RepID=UPI004036C510